MQAVAALRGQFGGHHVMTIAEGDELRAQAAEGPKSADAARAKAEPKEERDAEPRKPSKRDIKKATAEGRKAAHAGPSSGSGSTTEETGGAAKERDATEAGPTSGTGSTSD